MISEQSSSLYANIESKKLIEVFKAHRDILKNFQGEIVYEYSSVIIKLENKEDSFILTNSKNLIKEIIHIIKNYSTNDPKPLIKSLKKSNKDIIKEAICDWNYTETCVGALAKEMAFMNNENLSPSELNEIDKYIFEITFKNGEYKEKNRIVLK
ncbi:MAG: hypothetical protein R3Y05_02770 [bacterium]